MTETMFKFYAKAALYIVLIILPGTVVLSQQTEPTLVQPGVNGSAPADAIVLFDKGTLNMFESKKKAGGPAVWKVDGNEFTVVPGTGPIQTKEKFGDCQLHIEWKTPIKDVTAGKEGQNSGNSGIFLMSNYEVQVLNSHLNKTYPDGQAGSIYKQYPPLVNASLKPGEWQVYEIIFTAPRFNSDDTEKTPGAFTVFHNGVLVQNHVILKGPTHPVEKKSSLNQTAFPLLLQDHKSEVSYRNIWIRRL
ncbi:DUF1080 domain-containing protein [Chitinophaga sp. MM2321]|uniref:3-keto-disaccharide hydrolase n=1 Tax=Chitinophaga sp. MM2321 TaxID=3137178 RepID=UPI0032D59837